MEDELRVYGIKGFRVYDASVFPQTVSGHLQAPAVTIGKEKCGFDEGSTVIGTFC